jgi:hypothetical protein
LKRLLTHLHTTPPGTKKRDSTPSLNESSGARAPRLFAKRVSTFRGAYKERAGGRIVTVTPSLFRGTPGRLREDVPMTLQRAAPVPHHLKDTVATIAALHAAHDREAHALSIGSNGRNRSATHVNPNNQRSLDGLRQSHAARAGTRGI